MTEEWLDRIGERLAAAKARLDEVEFERLMVGVELDVWQRAAWVAVCAEAARLGLVLSGLRGRSASAVERLRCERDLEQLEAAIV